MRLAFSQGHELAPHGATAVAITPGWLRSEMMLDAFAVRFTNRCLGDALIGPGPCESDGGSRHTDIEPSWSTVLVQGPSIGRGSLTAGDELRKPPRSYQS